MKVIVRYKQEFNGQIIEDSYVRHIEDRSEVYRIEARLYSDPHVISVDVKVVEDE